MGKNSGDPVPRAARGKTGGEERVTAEQVAGYLRENPAFLSEHVELLKDMAPPRRELGDGVTDLQQMIIGRLRDSVSDLESEREELLLAGRNNLTTQAQVHEAVLALLSSQSFDHLIETVTTDLVVLLGVDVVTLCVEAAEDGSPQVRTQGVYRLPKGTVNGVLGRGRDVLLRSNTVGDPAIFGAGAGLVRSEALLRLNVSGRAPSGLLAFGSRDPGHFHSGQGTELLSFLVRALETMMRGWLNLPA
jgi:uncharacterized protein YigA (DUF484 family)